MRGRHGSHTCSGTAADRRAAHRSPPQSRPSPDTSAPAWPFWPMAAHGGSTGQASSRHGRLPPGASRSDCHFHRCGALCKCICGGGCGVCAAGRNPFARIAIVVGNAHRQWRSRTPCFQRRAFALPYVLARWVNSAGTTLLRGPCPGGRRVRPPSPRPGGRARADRLLMVVSGGTPTARLGNIVEAGHREVHARLAPLADQAQHQPQRDRVVCSRPPRWAWRHRRTGQAGAGIAFQPRGRGLDHPGIGHVQPRRRHGLAIAGAALAARARVGMPAIEGDAAVPLRQQQFGRRARAGAVVQADEIVEEGPWTRCRPPRG